MYTTAHLDPFFTRSFAKKLKQYQALACLPPGVYTQEAVIHYTLQLLNGVHPGLATVLNAELEAGNRVSTVCHWPSGALYINLLLPFTRKYKAKQLEYMTVKDPRYGSGSLYYYQQYRTSLAPLQYLTAGR